MYDGLINKVVSEILGQLNWQRLRTWCKKNSIVLLNLYAEIMRKRSKRTKKVEK